MKFKKKIENKLIKHRWSWDETIQEDQWYADEYWKVSSIGENYGQIVYICFMNDLERRPEKMKGFRVVAAQSLPTGGLNAMWDGITYIAVDGGQFDEELISFFLDLDEYRNNPKLFFSKRESEDEDMNDFFKFLGVL